MAVLLLGAESAEAQYVYSGAQNAMNVGQVGGDTTVEWNITGGYFGTSGARSQTYTQPNLVFTTVTQNNGWGEAVTRFSAATTVTGAGAFTLTNAGLGQDYVFAGDMQGYSGNISLADFGNSTITLGNTGSSVLQYGGETSGGNTALGTATTDGTGTWINNVAGTGSITANNVVFNYGTDASYDYVAVTNEITQRDSVQFLGNAGAVASGVITGGGFLQKAGTGTLTVTAANSYTGATNVAGGTLTIPTGGRLYATGAFFGDAISYVNVTNAATFATRNWAYGETGALSELRNNYYAVSVNGGTLRFTETSSSLRAFQVGASGATLSVDAGATYTKQAGTTGSENVIRFTANSTLTVTGDGDVVIADSLAPASYGNTGFGITKTGTGTLTLSGANAHTGSTTVSDGTLLLANQLAAQNSTVNYTGGSLVFSDTVAGNAFTFGGLSGSAALALANNAATPAGVAVAVGGNNANTSFTGNLTGAGSLTKAGTGTLTLGGGTVAPSGGITVAGGRLTWSRAGVVDLQSTNVTLDTGREMVVAISTGLTGGTITMGPGSLLGIQNGNNAGVTARGTVASNIALAAGSGATDAASIGGFIFGNNTRLTGVISGSGDLRWRTGILGGGSNSATAVAADNSSGWAVNSYTGATSFEGVSLTYTLASNQNNDVVNPFGDSANAVAITAGQLTFQQTGGTSNTTIIENPLALSATNAATTTFYRDDGNLRLSGTVDVSTTGTGTVRLQSRWGDATSKGLELAGVVTGSGSLVVTRATGEEGAIKLTNSGNTYSGTLTVNDVGGAAGILVLEADGAATAAAINLASSGAHLNVNATNATIAELAGVVGSAVSARTAGQTLTVNQTTNTTFAGTLGSTAITGADLGLNFTKAGSGSLTLTAANAYSGGTSVAAGTLLVNGSLANTSGVSIDSGATLGGSGSINAILSGAGLVSPGNSPGITTATGVDPSGGTAYAFEFTATGSPTYSDSTASVNDVLRLTDGTTPFVASLSGGNVVDVYFDVASLGGGDSFKGGFYTDLQSDFLASVENGSYAYWVKGNGTGTDRTFNGQGYFSLSNFDSGLSVTLSTVAETANFAGGSVNGQVMEFAVVPEPGTLVLVAAGLGLAGWQLARRRR